MLVAPPRQRHRRWGTASTPGGHLDGGVMVAASIHHSKSTNQRHVWMT